MRIWLHLTLTSFIIMATGLYVGCANIPFLKRNAELGDANRYISGATQWSEDFERVTTEAQESNRLILMNATGSDWCSWCLKLDEQVFQTPKFQKWADENFVLMKADYPENRVQRPEVAQQNQRLKERYGQMLQQFPTVLFLTPNGEVIGRMGYVQGGPSAFIKQAELQIGRHLPSANK